MLAWLPRSIRQHKILDQRHHEAHDQCRYGGEHSDFYEDHIDFAQKYVSHLCANPTFVLGEVTAFGRQDVGKGDFSAEKSTQPLRSGISNRRIESYV